MTMPGAEALREATCQVDGWRVRTTLLASRHAGLLAGYVTARRAEDDTLAGWQWWVECNGQPLQEMSGDTATAAGAVDAVQTRLARLAPARSVR